MCWSEVAAILSPSAGIQYALNEVAPEQANVLGTVFNPAGVAIQKVVSPGFWDNPGENYGSIFDSLIDPGNIVGRGAQSLGDMFPNALRTDEARTIGNVASGIGSLYAPWLGAAISGVSSELTNDWEGMTEEERRKKKNEKVLKGAITYGAGSLFGGGGDSMATAGAGSMTDAASGAVLGSAEEAFAQSGTNALSSGLSSGAVGTAADMGADVGLSQLMSDPGVTGLGQGVNAETYYGDGFESLIDEGALEAQTQTPGFGQTVLDTGQSVLGSAKGALGSVKDSTTGMLGSALKSPMTYLMAGNLLSNYLGAKSGQESQQAATQDNRTWWQQNAYPNQALVQAKQTAAGSDLSSRLAEAKRRYMEDAARRGLRGGSLAGGLASMERSTMKDYAKLANELIQFQNTAQFAPQGTSMVATQTPEQSLYGSLGNTAGTLAGYYAYKNLL
jgi:hypothetical protein